MPKYPVFAQGRRRRRRPKNTGGPLVKMGPRAVRQVKKIVKQTLTKREPLHHIDTILVDDFISTGTITNITPAIAQGSDVVSRQGDRVNIDSIRGRIYAIRNPDATSVAYDLNRLIIFKWYPDNVEDPPTEAKLIESPTYWFTSPTCLDKELSKKFKVIFDKSFFSGALDATLNASDNKPKLWKLNYKPSERESHIDFSPNTTTTGTGFYYVYHRGANVNGTDDTDFELYLTFLFEP